MKKWIAYGLLGVGIFLFLRSRSSASPGNFSAGIPTDPGTGGGGGLTVGQIGSNFFESNSLADAVRGLVDGIWDNQGQGYGGSLLVETPDGSLRYKAPISLRPLIPGYISGRYFLDP